VQPHGDRQHAALVFLDGAHQMGDDQADGPVGVTLAFDNLVGGAAHLLEQSFEECLGAALAEDGIAADRGAADVGAAPDCDLRVAVFAQDQGVNQYEIRSHLTIYTI